MEINIGNAPVSWGITEVEGWGGQKPYGEVLDEIARLCDSADPELLVRGGRGTQRSLPPFPRRTWIIC